VRKRNLTVALAIGIAVLPIGIGPATAGPGTTGIGAMHDEHHDADGGFTGDSQHGAVTGHLPATRRNVELVGKVGVHDKGAGRVADVGVLGNFAYEAAFRSPTCANGGVYVFDIANLRAPKEIGFIPTAAGSFVGEGIHPVHFGRLNSGFTGDLLLFNNEICDPAQPAPVGGATLVDISDPYHPKTLVNFGDFDDGAQAHQVHSAFMWADGRGKAYAVLVDDDENADVDIFDITDPAHPVKVVEHDLAAQMPRILQPNKDLDTVFFHDVIVRKFGHRQIMLLSYWDAGYVKLDVTDPVHPTYLADSDFAAVDPELKKQTGVSLGPEGNAHQAEFTSDGKYILAADEDFNPTRLAGRTDDGTAFRGGQGGQAPLGVNKSLTGRALYAGRACNADAAVPAPPETGGPYVAVVERGVCTFSEKAANVEKHGYVATLAFNRSGGASGGCAAFGATVTAAKPFFTVSRQIGYGLFDIEGQYDEAACQAGPGTDLAPVALGTLGDTVTLTSQFDGWGYVHLFRNNDGKIKELDTWALPEAMDPTRADGSGALSVHEVATSHCNPRLAYFSYYASGFRVTKIVNNRIVEVGRFIDEGGNDFWGVHVFQRDGVEYVAASDRDYGLYIFRYTGP
jgi:hypothetical protein